MQVLRLSSGTETCSHLWLCSLMHSARVRTRQNFMHEVLEAYKTCLLAIEMYWAKLFALQVPFRFLFYQIPSRHVKKVEAAVYNCFLDQFCAAAKWTAWRFPSFYWGHLYWCQNQSHRYRSLRFTAELPPRLCPPPRRLLERLHFRYSPPDGRHI